MKRKNTVAFAAVCAGLSLLTACGSGSSGSSSSGSGGSSGSGASGYNAGVTGIVNPSDHKGGTINLALSNTPDSTDPGNSYYALMWDLNRTYAVPLLTFADSPGNAGLKLVPGLATGLGQVSSDGKQWTYHLKKGVQFEDGTTITSKDVKYAVERSTNYAPDVLPNGPTYFNAYLEDSSYPGAYKDTTPDKMGLTSIETPDDSTIVFHLKQPFADFDYLVSNSQTAPVPQAKDTGAKYQEHPVSSGPYMFQSFDANKGFTLVRNPHWNPNTVPGFKQLPDAINVQYKIQQADIDARLLSGQIDLDLSGTGVQIAARNKILGNPSLKKNADDPLTGFLYYFALNTQVAPMDNVDCRKAVIYALDKTTQQAAYGGTTGGDIASTVLPPNVVGYQKADQYNVQNNVHGDQAKAKEELQKCGHPDGFSIGLSARGDRPKEVAAAQGAQEALAKVGIKADIQQFPTGQYFTAFAGSPNFVHQHNIGILAMGWGADFPTGFGFLSQMADGRAIKPAGNSNLQESNDPKINELLDKSTTENDATARSGIYAQIDQQLLNDAAIAPEVYAKALDYRNPNLTNVFVNPAWGMYDYTQIGKS